MALKSQIIPLLENVSKPSLKVIKAFACENIPNLLSNLKRDQLDLNSYEIEFFKLLRYMKKGNIRNKVERFRKNEINENEWPNYDPWKNKYRPKLPLFKQALTDLLEEDIGINF